MTTVPPSAHRLPLLIDDPPTAPPSRIPGLARGLLLVLLIFAGTRIVVWTAAYYGSFTLFRIEYRLDPPFEKHERQLAAEAADPNSAIAQRSRELLGDFMPLARFDGIHYATIVDGGYHYEKPAPGETDRRKLEQNIAFFPLYPLLAKALAPAIGTRPALILVANLAALLAALCFYSWLHNRLGPPAALFATAALLCWPSACYYSFAYAESTTLLCTVLALWCADRRHWLAAAVCAGLATATRPTALAVALVVLLAYWFASDTPRRKRMLAGLPLGVLAVSGIAAYAGFLWYSYGSPLVYLANFKAGWVPDTHRSTWLEYLLGARVFDQFKYFGRMFLAPPAGLINATNPFAWNMPLNFFLLFLSLGGLSRVAPRFRPLLLLGPLVFLHAYLASGGATFGVEPIGRYMAVAVPAFVILGVWAVREWPAGGRTALLVFLMLLQTAWAFRFGAREWSG